VSDGKSGGESKSKGASAAGVDEPRLALVAVVADKILSALARPGGAFVDAEDALRSDRGSNDVD
jgi:hypothetical protein